MNFEQQIKSLCATHNLGSVNISWTGAWWTVFAHRGDAVGIGRADHSPLNAIIIAVSHLDNETTEGEPMASMSEAA